MKKVLSFLALAAISTSAYAEASAHKITFSELPFTEGTIYISAICDNKEILRTAIDVTSDCASVDIDLSQSLGKKVSIQAFQDLDDNRRLDTDSYGKPMEPCLRTSITPQEGIMDYELKLVSY